MAERRAGRGGGEREYETSRGRCGLSARGSPEERLISADIYGEVIPSDPLACPRQWLPHLPKNCLGAHIPLVRLVTSNCPGRSAFRYALFDRTLYAAIALEIQGREGDDGGLLSDRKARLDPKRTRLWSKLCQTRPQEQLVIRPSSEMSNSASTTPQVVR